MLAVVTVCSAQVGGNGYRLGWELRLRKLGLVRAAVKLSQGSVVAVATGGGKPGTVNDQGSTVACLRVEEKQC